MSNEIPVRPAGRIDVDRTCDECQATWNYSVEVDGQLKQDWAELDSLDERDRGRKRHQLLFERSFFSGILCPACESLGSPAGQELFPDGYLNGLRKAAGYEGKISLYVLLGTIPLFALAIAALPLGWYDGANRDGVVILLIILGFAAAFSVFAALTAYRVVALRDALTPEQTSEPQAKAWLARASKLCTDHAGTDPRIEHSGTGSVPIGSWRKFENTPFIWKSRAEDVAQPGTKSALFAAFIWTIPILWMGAILGALLGAYSLDALGFFGDQPLGKWNRHAWVLPGFFMADACFIWGLIATEKLVRKEKRPLALGLLTLLLIASIGVGFVTHASEIRHLPREMLAKGESLQSELSKRQLSALELVALEMLAGAGDPTLKALVQDELAARGGSMQFQASAEHPLPPSGPDGSVQLVPEAAYGGQITGELETEVRLLSGSFSFADGALAVDDGAEVTLNETKYRYRAGHWGQVVAAGGFDLIIPGDWLVHSSMEAESARRDVEAGAREMLAEFAGTSEQAEFGIEDFISVRIGNEDGVLVLYNIRMPDQVDYHITMAVEQERKLAWGREQGIVRRVLDQRNVKLNGREGLVVSLEMKGSARLANIYLWSPLDPGVVNNLMIALEPGHSAKSREQVEELLEQVTGE